MPWKRLEDIFAGSLEDVLKTSWRRLEDALKRSRRRFEDIWPRQIYWSWPRGLEDVLKTSSEDEDERRIKDVFKMSSLRQMFAAIMAQNWEWVEIQPLFYTVTPQNVKTCKTNKATSRL